MKLLIIVLSLEMSYVLLEMSYFKLADYDVNNNGILY